MSMWSEREDFYRKNEENQNLKRIGDYIRDLPVHNQEQAKSILQDTGVDVYGAMHQSARNRYDPYW